MAAITNADVHTFTAKSWTHQDEKFGPQIFEYVQCSCGYRSREGFNLRDEERGHAQELGIIRVEIACRGGRNVLQSPPGEGRDFRGWTLRGFGQEEVIVSPSGEQFTFVQHQHKGVSLDGWEVVVGHISVANPPSVISATGDRIQ